MTQLKGAKANVDLTVTTGDLKTALEQFQKMVSTIQSIPKATGEGNAAVTRLADALKKLAKDSDSGDVAASLKLVSKELKTINALAKGTEIFTQDQQALAKIMADRVKLYADQALLHNKMLGKGVSEREKMEMDEALRVNQSLGKILRDRQKLYEDQALAENKLLGKGVSEKRKMQLDEELRQNKALGAILDQRAKLYEDEALRQNKLAGKKLDAKQRLEEEEELRKNRELGKILDQRAKLYEDEALRQNRLAGKTLDTRQRMEEEEELRKNRELGKILDQRVKLYEDEALRQNKLAGKTLNTNQRLNEEEELRKNRDLGKILDQRAKLYDDEALHQNKLAGKLLNEKQRLEETEELRKNRELGKILDERIRLYEQEALRQNQVQRQIMQWRQKAEEDEALRQNKLLGQAILRQRQKTAETTVFNPSKALSEFGGEINLGKAGKLQAITAEGYAAPQVIAAQREVRKIQQEILEVARSGYVTDKDRMALVMRLLAAKKEELALSTLINQEQRESEAAQRSLARIGGQGGAGLLAIQASLMANYTVLNLFTGAISRAISGSVELEAAFRNVQAVTGTTRTEMAGLEKTIEQTAAGTKFSSKEVADAALILGQAGLSAKQVGEALPAVTMLAAAAGSNLAQAVDLVTSVIGVFDKKASDTADIANKITQAANSSKVSVDKLALGFQYAGNIAAQMGISFEETTAAMAAMSNAGIKSGSTMGTGLRQFIVETEKPSQEFLATITRLGLTMADLDFKSNGLIGVAQKLRQVGFVASDAIKSFDVRGAAAFNALIANPEDMERQYKLLLNTKAGVEANEIQMDSFKSQATRLTTSLENLASAGLGPVTKALTLLVGGVASVIQGLSEMGPLVGIAGTALAALGTTVSVAYMANLAAGFSKIIATLPIFTAQTVAATVALEGQAVAAGTAAVATEGVAVAMKSLSLATGIGIAITALIGIVTAWNYAMDEGKRKLDELKAATNQSKEAFDSKADSVKSLDAKLDNLSQREIMLRNDTEAVKRESQALTSQYGALGGVIDANNTSYDVLISKLMRVREETIKLRNASLGAALTAAQTEQSALGTQAETDLKKAQGPAFFNKSSNAETLQKYLLANQDKIKGQMGTPQFESMMRGSGQLVTGDKNHTEDIAFLGQSLKQIANDPKMSAGMDSMVKTFLSQMSNSVEEFNRSNANYLGKSAEVDNLLGRRSKIQGMDKFEQMNPNFRTMLATTPNLEEMAKSGVSKAMAAKYGIAEREPMSADAAKRPDELAAVTKGLGQDLLRARDAAFKGLKLDGASEDVKGEVQKLFNEQTSVITNRIMGVQAYAKPTINYRLDGKIDELDAELKTLNQKKNKTDDEKRRTEDLIQQKYKLKADKATQGLLPSIDPANAPGEFEALMRANNKQRDEEINQFRQRPDNFMSGLSQKEIDAKLKTLGMNKNRTQEDNDQAKQLIRDKFGLKGTELTKGFSPSSDPSQPGQYEAIMASNESQMNEALKQWDLKKSGGRADRSPGQHSRIQIDMFGMEEKAERRAAEVDKSLANLMDNYDDVTDLYNKGAQHLTNAGEFAKKKLAADQNKKKNDLGKNFNAEDQRAFDIENAALEDQLVLEMEQFRAGFKGYSSLAGKRIHEMTQKLKEGEQKFASDKVDAEERVYNESALLRELTLEQELGKKTKSEFKSKNSIKLTDVESEAAGKGTSIKDSYGNTTTYPGSAGSRETSGTTMRFTSSGVSTSMGSSLSQSNGLNASMNSMGKAGLNFGAAGNDSPTTGTLKQRIARETVRVTKIEKEENEKLLAELGDDQTGLIGGYTDMVNETAKKIEDLQPRLEKLRKAMLAGGDGDKQAAAEFTAAAAEMKELQAANTGAKSSRATARGQLKGVRSSIYANDKTIAQNTDVLPQEVSLDNIEAKVKQVWGTWREAQADMDPMKTFGDGFGSILGNVTGQFANMFSEIASGTNSVSGAFKSMAGNVIKSIMSVIAQMLAMKAVQMLIGMFSAAPASGASLSAASVSSGPAAFGTVPGSTYGALGSGFSSVGAVPSIATGGLILASGQVERIRHMAGGGSVTGGVSGKDSVPTMLMPGEFVVKKTAVDAVGTDYLHALNQTANNVVSSDSPSASKQDSGGGGVVNVWVVSPDQQPSGLGPKDVIVTITDDISRGGSVKQMIKQVMMGA